jgi:endonuclease/exonuclease/phosphatase family metal-dependent hydrolase
MDRRREPNHLRLLSFNLRYSESREGENIWKNRCPLVAKILKTYCPDIAGFQEVLVDQLQDLKRMLPDYLWVGVGRKDGEQHGEFAPLFFPEFEGSRNGALLAQQYPGVA